MKFKESKGMLKHAAIMLFNLTWYKMLFLRVLENYKEVTSLQTIFDRIKVVLKHSIQIWNFLIHFRTHSITLEVLSIHDCIFFERQFPFFNKYISFRVLCDLSIHAKCRSCIPNFKFDSRIWKISCHYWKMEKVIRLLKFWIRAFGYFMCLRTNINSEICYINIHAYFIKFSIHEKPSIENTESELNITKGI